MSKIRSLQLKSPASRSLSVPGSDPWHVSLNDPALSAMTDFHERAAVTVSDQEPIDAALEHMKHAGVRAAFVVDATSKQVVGLITAYDIQGEKPLRHLEVSGGTPLASKRNEVQVRDIMEKMEEWLVADIKDVEEATVGVVFETFQETGRTHIVVVEAADNRGERLRGLFSSAKTKRLIG